MDEECEPLFSYGTLQDAKVQRSRFGRLLAGDADALRGYRLGLVAISDPDVVRQSGKPHHPALIPGGDNSMRIAGTLYWLTPGELEAADAYEAREYARRRVSLESGREAWVYVAAADVKVE